jgi:hypothetical protein
MLFVQQVRRLSHRAAFVFCRHNFKRIVIDVNSVEVLRSICTMQAKPAARSRHEF